MSSSLDPDANPVGGSSAEPATTPAVSELVHPGVAIFDDDLPPLPPLPGQDPLLEPTDTPQRANKRHRRCAVEGCGKQSQGGRNRNMCRTHFREWYQASHPEGGDGSGSAAAGSDHAGGSSADNSAGHAVGKPSRTHPDQARPRCGVAGCGKQSQGRRCNGMCQRHYNEASTGLAARPMGTVTVSSAAGGGGNGAMAMAAATMADMNMDAVSVSTLGTAASSGTPPPLQGSGGQRRKPLCSVVGCIKQSQGIRKNHMCAAHFREKFGPPPAPGPATTGGGGTTRRRGKGRSRYNDKSSTHPLCAINKCPKQSQGGRCNFMCTAHFRQYGYEPPLQESEDSDVDDDDEEGDAWDGGESEDDDGKGNRNFGRAATGGGGDAYERNNGYYAPFSPEYNDSTNFEVNVDDTMPPLPSTNESVPPLPPVPPVPPLDGLTSTAGTARFDQVEEGDRNGDPFVFEPSSNADSTSSSERPDPPASPRRYASPARVMDDEMLSPSQRRKCRLDKKIDHAKKVAASPAASVVKKTPVASLSSPLQKEEPKKDDIPKREIQSKPPPRRIEYLNQKSLQKPSRDISSSLTTLGPSATGSIDFLDTLGRCHIAQNDACGFRWFPKDSTLEKFIASEFVGYNQGLGRVYFKSFVHRGRKIEVGNFVKKRFGNTTEYYRIAGVFQATVSFLGDWEDGSFPPEGSERGQKGEIQKRGHPYLIVIPLKLKSDAVSGKTRKNLKARKGSTANDRASKSALRGGKVEKELVLAKEEQLEPNNIFVLPMWLGEPGVTFETINVCCKNARGKELVIKAADHDGSGSGKKRRRADDGETFICRRAMKQAPSHKRTNEKRQKGTKETEIESEEDALLTKYLTKDQFQLLTANPKQLLENFIPLQWAPSFNACRTQFICSWEERSWYDDATPNLDFFPNPYASSDDSDGFDEESKLVLGDTASTHNDAEGVADKEAAKVAQHVPVPDIGEGWTVSETQRMSGATKGKRDKTWHSPCGQSFRSLVQVKKFIAKQARQKAS